MYTIRCEALKFKLRKSHKKVLKKVNKYLIEGIKPSGDVADNDNVDSPKKLTKVPAKTEKHSEEVLESQVDNTQHVEQKVTQGSSKDMKTPRKGNKLYFRMICKIILLKNSVVRLTIPCGSYDSG